MGGAEFEIKRKIFHMLLGILLTILIYYDIIKFWNALVLLIVGLIISYTYRARKLVVIDWFLQQFERPEHIKKFPGRGAIYITLSLTILMLLYESHLLTKNIVLASIMIWTFGDSLSAIIGNLHSRIRHPFNDSRCIEGTASGIVGGMFGALLFVPLLPAFIASFIAITIESLELSLLKHPIDDNLLVPLISALVLVILL